MPKALPTTIYFKNNSKKVLQAHEGVTIDNGMLTLYAVEPKKKIREERIKGKWGKPDQVIPKEVTVPTPVPIKSFPLGDILNIDHGYMTQEQFQARLTLEKKEQEQREKEKKILEEERAKKNKGTE